MKRIVVIGGGLTGLGLAHWLKKNEYDVVLLEATERLGARFRGGGELGFITPSEQASSTLEWLRSISPTPVQTKELDLQPLYFEGGEWRPFLGFGDFPAKSVDELAFLCQPKHWRLESSFEQITRAMVEQLPMEARTRAEVTGLEVENGRVRAAVVNGQEKIFGDEFIFCPSPHLLHDMLPHDSLKPVHRSRLAKLPDWICVTLTLEHREPIEATPAFRFVLGSGKEFEPVVGYITPTRSVWMNLVSNDYDDDIEHIGDCVRFIRRTLKRVFPQVLELSTDEKIRIQPHGMGKIDLKLKEQLSFPELPNLYLADARLSSVPGELSTAAIAHQIARLFVAERQKPVLSDIEAG